MSRPDRRLDSKRLLRTHDGAPLREPAKPQCTLHRQAMRFDPTRNAWRCTITGCVRVKYPAEGDHSRPVVGSGKLTLLVDSGPPLTVYIRTENNVIIDVSDYVAGVEPASGGCVPVLFSFNDVIDMAGMASSDPSDRRMRPL